MLHMSLFRPGRWVVLALGSVSVVTVASFSNAQFGAIPVTPPFGNPPPGANTVNFAPGAGIPLRGVPFQGFNRAGQGIQRPVNNSFSLPGPVFFGGFPTPVQNMPLAPTLPRGFGQ